jgi:hypothetical protein
MLSNAKVLLTLPSALGDLNASCDDQRFSPCVAFPVGLLELAFDFRLRIAAGLEIVKSLNRIALHACSAAYERDGNQHGNQCVHCISLPLPNRPAGAENRHTLLAAHMLLEGL